MAALTSLLAQPSVRRRVLAIFFSISERLTAKETTRSAPINLEGGGEENTMLCVLCHSILPLYLLYASETEKFYLV